MKSRWDDDLVGRGVGCGAAYEAGPHWESVRTGCSEIIETRIGNFLIVDKLQP